jgi:hypothetical protein
VTVNQPVMFVWRGFLAFACLGLLLVDFGYDGIAVLVVRNCGAPFTIRVL